MSEVTVRPAVSSDMPDILRIYEYARRFMAESGNPSQWVNGWPWPEVLEEDIAAKQLYVLEDESGMYGVFAFIIGEDPTYREITGGSWLYDGEYGTIHRIAGDGRVCGVLEKALDFCFEKINHVRIDTHADNKIMQHLLEKFGFIRCGIIRCTEDGTPRIAYEKVYAGQSVI